MNDFQCAKSDVAQHKNPAPTELFPPDPGEITGPDQPANQKQKFRPNGSLFEVFPSLQSFKNLCDYLGGSREDVPARHPLLASPWLIGLWWGLLAGVILLFCGQTSKFIYIDF